jgi:hypothetical protein
MGRDRRRARRSPAAVAPPVRQRPDGYTVKPPSTSQCAPVM